MTTLQSFEINKRLGDIFHQAFLSTEILDRVVSGIELDSRKIKQGDLFIALKGDHVDGRDFTNTAIENGARVVIEESKNDQVRYLGDSIIIESTSIKNKVSAVAARFYDDPSKKLKVIAITGTNGKSTCVSLLAQLLNAQGIKCGTVGTLGYGFVDEELLATGMTTPDAVECQRILFELLCAGAEAVAIEASSHGLSQKRLAAVDISFGVFTNLTRDHLDYHAGFGDYKRTKFSLFVDVEKPISIVNVDDESGKELFDLLTEMNRNVHSYSLMNPSANIYVRELECLEDGFLLELDTPWGAGEAKLNIIGDFNIYNLLSILSVACELGCDFHGTLDAIQQLHGAKGRVERVGEGDSNISVYIDYAHTPDALEKTISVMKKHTKKNVWVVFGCGGDRDRGKRCLMGNVAGAYANKIVVTSDNPRTENPQSIIQDILTGLSGIENVKVIEDRRKAIEFAIVEADTEDCVLIAGKGHEDYQEIGRVRYPFSDLDVALQGLKQRPQYHAVRPQ